jgi:hypothetical protein
MDSFGQLWQQLKMVASEFHVKHSLPFRHNYKTIFSFWYNESFEKLYIILFESLLVFRYSLKICIKEDYIIT